MAYPPVPTPPFPNVPPDNGVPSLFRDPLVPVYTIRLIEADVVILSNINNLIPEYGIFTQGGSPVVIPNTIVALDYRKEARVSEYPVEQGGFQSYDKVQVPYDVRIRMGCDGSTTPKALFLSQIDNAYRAVTELYAVYAKDVQYQSATITHYDYRLERENGVGVLIVDVWLQEVRVTVQTSFTNTQTASGANAVNDGTVQTTTPTSAEGQLVGPAGGLT